MRREGGARDLSIYLKYMIIYFDTMYLEQIPLNFDQMYAEIQVLKRIWTHQNLIRFKILQTRCIWTHQNPKNGYVMTFLPFSAIHTTP